MPAYSETGFVGDIGRRCSCSSTGSVWSKTTRPAWSGPRRPDLRALQQGTVTATQGSEHPAVAGSERAGISRGGHRRPKDCPVGVRVDGRSAGRSCSNRYGTGVPGDDQDGRRRRRACRGRRRRSLADAGEGERHGRNTQQSRAGCSESSGLWSRISVPVTSAGYSRNPAHGEQGDADAALPVFYGDGADHTRCPLYMVPLRFP
jgi:hypothetical protein